MKLLFINIVLNSSTNIINDYILDIFYVFQNSYNSYIDNEEKYKNLYFYT